MRHATRWATLRLVLITLLVGSAIAVGVSGQSPASNNPLVGACA